MRKARKQIKTEAKTLFRTNPVIFRQILVFRLISFAVSLVLGLFIGNPIDEVMRVVELVEAGGFTIDQQSLILMRAIEAHGGSLAMSLAANIIWFMISSVLVFGVLTSIRRAVVGEGPIELSDLTSGISVFARVVSLNILKSLNITCYFVIIFVPLMFVSAGIIGFLGPIAGSFFFWLFTMLSSILTVWFSCRYTFAEYILAENPGLTGPQALRASVTCSKQRIREIFFFAVSFLGWSALILLADFGLSWAFEFLTPTYAGYIVSLILIPAKALLSAYMLSGYTIFFRNFVGLDQAQEPTPDAPPPDFGGTGSSYTGPDIQI